MRIIHCVNQYMPFALAGTEVYTHSLAKLQQDDGHTVVVITPCFDRFVPGVTDPQYIYDTIRVCQFYEPSETGDRDILYGFKKPAGIGNFLELLQKLQPDIVHFHQLNRSIGFTAAHVKAAKQLGVKTLLTMHLSSYTCSTNVMIYKNKLCDGKIRHFNCTSCFMQTIFKTPAFLAGPLSAITQIAAGLRISKNIKESKIKTFLMLPEMISRIREELESLVENIDHFVCIALWYRDVLISNGVPADKLYYIPQGVNILQKSIDLDRVHNFSSPVKIVFVGRIQPTKGIDIIIQAMKKYTPEKITIDFFGRAEDTDYYNECRRAAAGIENIRWKGPLEIEEVIPALKKYDVLCLASTFSEMSPLVIQEAFAAGIPVLASKVYGNMEQVEHEKNGLLFDFNSITDLQLQLEKLIRQPSLITAMKSNIRAPRSFREVHEKYIELYTS